MKAFELVSDELNIQDFLLRFLIFVRSNLSLDLVNVLLTVSFELRS